MIILFHRVVNFVPPDGGLQQIETLYIFFGWNNVEIMQNMFSLVIFQGFSRVYRPQLIAILCMCVYVCVCNRVEA